MNQPNLPQRRFLGKRDNFANKEEKVFEQRHYRAYLKGNAVFKFRGENYYVKSEVLKTTITKVE